MKTYEEDGVIYKIKRTKLDNCCSLCDASYDNGNSCRVACDCYKNEYMEVIDKTTRLKAGDILKNKNRIVAVVGGGGCNQCCFMKRGCSLKGYVCKGDKMHIVKLNKGGL